MLNNVVTVTGSRSMTWAEKEVIDHLESISSFLEVLAARANPEAYKMLKSGIDEDNHEVYHKEVLFRKG